MNRKVSEEELNEKIKKLFPTKVDFIKGSRATSDGIYEEDEESDKK